eukprot:4973183-Prymnesium_polylepis.1
MLATPTDRKRFRIDLNITRSARKSLVDPHTRHIATNDWQYCLWCARRCRLPSHRTKLENGRCCTCAQSRRMQIQRVRDTSQAILCLAYCKTSQDRRQGHRMRFGHEKEFWSLASGPEPQDAKEQLEQEHGKPEENEENVDTGCSVAETKMVADVWCRGESVDY